MNNDWAFLPMRESNDLLGDPSALRSRLDEDSYLLLRGVIDREKVMEVRHDVTSVLARHGWIYGGTLLDDAVTKGEAFHEDQEEFLAAYNDVQRLESLHTLAHDESLVAVMQQVVGPTAFPHPLKIARLAFPAHFEVSTPPHQDYPNNQGTPDLLASWVPLGDCPRRLGALAVLRASHHQGMLPLAFHGGAGKRQAVVPDQMLEDLRWVTTDFEAGDVLLFPAMAVHAALHNTHELNMRLSVDFRWQQEGAALTEVCLHPHFQRIDWDDVYQGWSSTEHQYYWRDLDYEVVPFETIPVQGASADDAQPGDLAFEDAIRAGVGSGEIALSPADVRAIMVVEAHRKTRRERRSKRVAALYPDAALDTEAADD